MKTQVILVPNPDCEAKKTKTKTQHVQNKNPRRFFYKNKIRTKQIYDKITYPKLMLNILKVIKGPTSIYTP
jgi:hypothetical protein